jgi:SAM-dependent methyltransferase
MTSDMTGKVHTRLERPKSSTRRKARWVSVLRAAQVPVNLLRAAAAGLPGVRFHFALMGWALRGLGKHLTVAQAHELFAQPMDSVRYFEFDFLWQTVAAQGTMGDYLDVSSPRLFSFRALLSGKASRAVIANPDGADLAATRTLFANAGVAQRCEFHQALVSDLAAMGRSFDTISCISVLEHIPPAHTRQALADMWSMLKPGGRMLLSVPCARTAFDEYINFNEYGLLDANEQGFVFGQRFFDEDLLRSEILATTGTPSRMAVFGEMSGGESFANRQAKLSDSDYPYWRESLFVAENYRLFGRIGDLPGLGVIGLEFVKQ